MNQIKILIVDDHYLVRAGIRSLLEDLSEIKIVGEAENGKEAIEQTGKLLPDVVLIDISMPEVSGIEATGVIKEKFPNTNVLVLTMHENEEYFYSALKKGASGILHKNTGKDEMILAIKTVAGGNKYFGTSLSKLILESLVSKHESGNVQGNEKIMLTKREKEVMHYIAEGLSNQEIADKLGISVRTVDSHKGNLMQKLNLRTSSALSRYAFENDFYLNDGRT